MMNADAVRFDEAAIRKGCVGGGFEELNTHVAQAHVGRASGSGLTPCIGRLNGRLLGAGQGSN